MSELFFLLVYVAPPLFFLLLGYLVGTYAEQTHLKVLAERESRYRHIGVTNLKRPVGGGPVIHSAYVNGQAVIASDYFKTFMALLRNIFGGRVRAFESLMMRARREALLRLLEEADRMGAREVCNIRFETSTIGRGIANKGLPTAEIHAYGTAVVHKN